MNPAPGPVYRVGRSEEHPDEKRREERSPARIGYVQGGAEVAVMKSALDPVVEEIEDLEWPEIIDVS
jgi:hypothetical protein